MLDSSSPGWENTPCDGEGLKLSVCIAATCEYEGQPCIVHCSDMAGTRAEIKSDDIHKIQSIGSSTVMFAGENSHARNLIDECFSAIEAYQSGSNEISITNLKLALNDAIKRRKRYVSDAFLSSRFGLSWGEVFNFSNANPKNQFYTECWDHIARLTLGAELIITTFSDDEAVILHVPIEGGEAKWPDHYATIGTGSRIADTYLRQKAYDDDMSIAECLYRVLEAKTAAEGDLYVGQATAIEVSTPDGSFEVADSYIDRVIGTIERRREKVPEIKFNPKFLVKIEDDDASEDAAKAV